VRICFFGTPEFAVPSLRMLINEGHDIAGVFTQPDRPKGRSKKPVPPPVKELALSAGIPVFQFEKIRLEGLDALRELKPEICVSAAFGQIFSKEIIDVAPLGIINVHASLLPKLRGAAPIQWAIINGDTETGVTTMHTDEGIDTGDMILSAKTTILPDENSAELSLRLSEMGAELLCKTLRLIEKGEAPRHKQNEVDATRCPMLKKETGRIDWQMPVTDIINLIRGVNPWPGAYTSMGDGTLKIWKASAFDGEATGRPGEVIVADGKAGIIVKAKDGALRLDEMQLPGGKRMSGADAARGRSFLGAVLGE
jgi:methionyl-tRNA formyltransferase